MGAAGGAENGGRASHSGQPGRFTEPLNPPRPEIGRIILAREAPLRVGPLSIEPVLRRVAHDDGRQEILEPWVMQVLVALIQARGRILTRDDLLMSYWHGVVVAEDAINRVTGRLRRIADGIGEGAFKLETITKVGYRLVSDGLRVASATPPPASAEPLLAVLAFDNLCDGEDMACFTDGVSEEILQTVVRGSALKVIGRGSGFQFRGADKAAGRVAAALKATHVLDGSVRRSGDKVRIVAHLIECAGETTLWSDRFDRDLSDIFVLQDEIAGAFARALMVVFAPATPAKSIDPAAYDLYLEARRIIANRFALDIDTSEAVIQLFEQATARAPNFARAWAELADARVKHMLFQDYQEPYPTARARVVEAAMNALRFDPGMGQVYQVLAELEPCGAVPSREALHETALTVSPRDPGVLFQASIFTANVGRIGDALDYIEQARCLDPMFSLAAAWHGAMLEAQGRYGESRPLWERARDLWPDSDTIAWNAIAAAAHNADWARFDDLVAATRARGVNDPAIRGLIWYGRNLRKPDSDSITAAFEQCRDDIARLGDVQLEWLSSLYQLGLKNEVFEMINRASFAYVFDPKRKYLGGFGTITLFSQMHSAELMRDSRLPGLCAKLGLCDYWVQTGRWPDCAEFVSPHYDFKAEARRLATSGERGSS